MFFPDPSCFEIEKGCFLADQYCSGLHVVWVFFFLYQNRFIIIPVNFILFNAVKKHRENDIVCFHCSSQNGYLTFRYDKKMNNWVLL